MCRSSENKGGAAVVDDSEQLDLRPAKRLLSLAGTSDLCEIFRRINQ
jgi:hypothetical protein